MKQWVQACQNRRGLSTVELVIILSGLVTAALLLRHGLENFNEKAEATFRDVRKAEVMTFGGDVKAPRSRTAAVGDRPAASPLRNLFDRTIGNPLRDMLSAGRAEPVAVVHTSDPGARSPEALNRVLNQFDVESAPRYQPSVFSTYCNIFAWDATRAMNAEIPHWINRRTGEPYSYDTNRSYSENARIAAEVNVNTLYDWMQDRADSIGYREVSESEARAAANLGMPAVALWKNPSPSRSGHIVVLRPYDDTREGRADVTYIAQAGRYTYTYIEADKIFSPDMMRTVRFYVHE